MPTTGQKKPAAPKPEPEDFTFEHNDTTYHLPGPSDALVKLPGRALRDALLDGETGQLALAFRAIEASGADAAAVDALYEKPVPEMTEIIMHWFQSAQVQGATIPQS